MVVAITLYILIGILIICMLLPIFPDKPESQKSYTSAEKRQNKSKEDDVYNEINIEYSTYELVLWLADDGLKLNDDGTTEWIKRSKPTNNRFSVIPRNVFQELTEESGTIHKSSRYQIWDKQSYIYAISGVYTPKEWIELHPWILEQGAIPVVSAGIFNGMFLSELGELKQRCEENGAVFKSGISNEELLYDIEMFEDTRCENRK